MRNEVEKLKNMIKLMKLQIDEPDTKFEFKDLKGDWCSCSPSWNIGTEYRVKVEDVYEYEYMYKIAAEENKYTLTEHREKCTFEGFEKVEKTKRMKID